MRLSLWLLKYRKRTFQKRPENSEQGSNKLISNNVAACYRTKQFNTHVSCHVPDLRSTAVHRNKPHRGQTRGCKSPKPTHLLKRQTYTRSNKRCQFCIEIQAEHQCPKHVFASKVQQGHKQNSL